MSITSAGSNPISWQAGQAQLPPRRHAEKPPEPAATALGAAGEDRATERTQKRMWADTSAVGQSAPWDAGRDRARQRTARRRVRLTPERRLSRPQAIELRLSGHR